MSITSPKTTWIPSTSTFGARLALVRWRMTWNIAEAAAACGLNESNWRGWELDGRSPRGLNDVADRISEATGVDKYWLIDGEGQPSDYKAPVVPPVVDIVAHVSAKTRPANRQGNTGPRKRVA
jgi:hypothetical protein